MAKVLTLFDLFGEITLDGAVSMWPPTVQPTTGRITNWPPATLRTWLSNLNDLFTAEDARTGADGDRVAVEARLAMTQAAPYPDGFPFVISSMPDVEFRLQYATPQENRIHLLASVSDRGAGGGAGARPGRDPPPCVG